MEELKRYFLDVRTGIVAIRDRQHPSYDIDAPGLHPYYEDIVTHINGTYKDSEWTLPDYSHLEKMCDYLNNLWSDSRGNDNIETKKSELLDRYMKKYTSSVGDFGEWFSENAVNYTNELNELIK